MCHILCIPVIVTHTVVYDVIAKGTTLQACRAYTSHTVAASRHALYNPFFSEYIQQ